MKAQRELCVYLAALILGAGTASASVDNQGFYDVYQGGLRVGSERYSWRDAGEGQAVLEGECVVEVNGVSTTLRPSLVMDSNRLTPVSFALRQTQGNDTREVATTFEGTRAEQVVREDGMESRKSFKINPADLVVDDNVLHLFLVLAERYDFGKGGEQDLTVFDVNSRKAYTAHCRLRGLGTFENNVGKFRARRLTIDLESLSVDLLVDTHGRVPLISIPMKKVEGRLQGYDGQEHAELIR